MIVSIGGHLRSRPVIWIASDNIHVGILTLIPPHFYGGGQQFLDGASCSIARVAYHSQVLATGLKLVRVVASVVLHLALAHIEGGQLSQLGTPAHGGHSSGWLVFGQLAQGQIVAPHVVQTHHMFSLCQIQFDELGCRTGRTLGSPGLGMGLLIICHHVDRTQN